MSEGGYPIHVEEYVVDVLSINSIVGRYKKVYLFAVFDSDGQLIGFTIDRPHSDMLCLKLTAADRQARINERMQQAVVDVNTRELPPRWETNPPPPLPPLSYKTERDRWKK